MRKITIFNQEIEIDSQHMPQRSDLLSDLKIIFLKKCILDILVYFSKQTDLPQDLRGFALHLETEINDAQLKELSDQALAYWLRDIIHASLRREQLHPAWGRRTPMHCKLSFLLEKLGLRLFEAHSLHFNKNSDLLDAALFIEKSVQASISHVQYVIKMQIEAQNKQILILALQQAYQNYCESCWWPIGHERHVHYLQLLSQVEQAQSVQLAAQIVYAQSVEIERRHQVHSFWANLCCYRRQSRWAYHVQQALIQTKAQIEIEIRPKCNKVVFAIEQAIMDYLAQDTFYHNRARRSLAYQLLTQLQCDVENHTSAQTLQRQYKMRRTLDEYIQKIDDSYASTYFFSKYYKRRRSRLALQLEATKLGLIQSCQLPALDLKSDIKQPIITQLQRILLDLCAQYKQVDATLSMDLRRDCTSVCHAILDAQTPHAIEMILESHISSYAKHARNAGLITTFQHMIRMEDNIYFVMAIKIESALLEWQSVGLLPHSSGYNSFLSTIANERQNNENELQDLERRYGIKIPRNPAAMRAQVQHTQSQAQTLLKRLQNL